MLFLTPLLTSVIKRVQNVPCQACELTTSNTMVLMMSELEYSLPRTQPLHHAPGGRVSVFPEETALWAEFSSAKPMRSVCRAVSHFSFRHQRGICDGEACTSPLVQESSWVVTHVGTPEITNKEGDQSCSLIRHTGGMMCRHRAQRCCLDVAARS